MSRSKIFLFLLVAVLLASSDAQFWRRKDNHKDNKESDKGNKDQEEKKTAVDHDTGRDPLWPTTTANPDVISSPRVTAAEQSDQEESAPVDGHHHIEGHQSLAEKSGEVRDNDDDDDDDDDDTSAEEQTPSEDTSDEDDDDEENKEESTTRSHSGPDANPNGHPSGQLTEHSAVPAENRPTKEASPDEETQPELAPVSHGLSGVPTPPPAQQPRVPERPLRQPGLLGLSQFPGPALSPPSQQPASNPAPTHGSQQPGSTRPGPALIGALPVPDPQQESQKTVVVDGQWSSWMAVTSCSTTCGVGSLTASRQCNSPSPRNGGALCVGANQRILGCSRRCPDDPLQDTPLIPPHMSAVVLPSGPEPQPMPSALPAVK